MDGILGDGFVNGRRLRPATLEYALENYTKVVAWIKLGQVGIIAPYECDGNDVVQLRYTLDPTIKLAMTRQDFDKCIVIAQKMTIPLFPSEPDTQWYARASAYVRQSFG